MARRRWNRPTLHSRGPPPAVVVSASKALLSEASVGPEKEVMLLSIEGLNGPTYLLRSELESLLKGKPSDNPTITLLPYLDPCIFEYKDRERYMGVISRDLISDRAGNGTSFILLNGRIVGVWDFEEGTVPTFKLPLFTELPTEVLSTTKEKGLWLGAFIADEPVDLKLYHSMTPF